MTASTFGNDDSQELDYGLIAGHAYSLLGAYEIMAGDKKVQLVKIRNPWGIGEW